MGRRPIGLYAMTVAERVARHRANKREEEARTKAMLGKIWRQGRNSREEWRHEIELFGQILECFDVCRTLAKLDAPEGKEGNCHPDFERDWGCMRPWWLPPPGLIEHLKAVERSEYGTLPWQYYHEGSPAREFMGHYDPEVGWPWRKNKR
jgi:hypothetical protein